MFFPYKDDNPKVLIPYVNYSIIGINILIFIFQFTTGINDPEAEAILFYTYGLIPANFSVLDMLTSMFLHGGIAHILGNMWFLWIFGDNVESTLGHVRYIIFYILCGVFAALCQVLMSPGSEIPMVGASGAIAGVLGLYMIRFPKAQVHVFIFIIIFFTTIRVPAIIVLVFWFFNQLTSGLGSLGLDITGGVAWFAHVGGFIAGIMLHQVFKLIK